MARPAEAGWELLDRLLLAGGELRVAVDQPDGMVQVEDVDPGDCSVGVDELRVEASDVAVLLGPELVDPIVRRTKVDGVLARGDGDWPVAVGEMLDARVVDVSCGSELVDDRRAPAVHPCTGWR